MSIYTYIWLGWFGWRAIFSYDVNNYYYYSCVLYVLYYSIYTMLSYSSTRFILYWCIYPLDYISALNLIIELYCAYIARYISHVASEAHYYIPRFSEYWILQNFSEIISYHPLCKTVYQLYIISDDHILYKNILCEYFLTYLQQTSYHYFPFS